MLTLFLVLAITFEYINDIRFGSNHEVENTPSKTVLIEHLGCLNNTTYDRVLQHNISLHCK